MVRLRLLFVFAVFALALSDSPSAFAADAPQKPKAGEPTDPKAQKTYADALGWLHHGQKSAAVSELRKANQQDGGHCTECLRRAYLIASETADYKVAEEIGREMLVSAATPADKAIAHYEVGIALQRQGALSKKARCYEDSCVEFRAALDAAPQLSVAHYSMGMSLAHVHQDDPARHEFTTFIDQDKTNLDMHERAKRMIENLELARASMAPAFSLTTIDGQKISMDGLTGKVVLIDFWATWCGPCRQALPHIRQIAQKFKDQPLVVLSISVDTDDAKWRDFVGKNGMTWLQARANGFGSEIPTMFGVHAIPSTFSIDADGVLEDQHVGDAEVENKLKKMITRAVELGKEKGAQAATAAPSPAQP